MSALPSTPARPRTAWVGLYAAVLFLVPAALRAEDKAVPDAGLYITVGNPITDQRVGQIRQDIAQARNRSGRPVTKVVFDFNPEGKEASTRTYGACYELAKEIRNLSNNGVTTVAFVHAKTTGNTVLPVIACNDLVMSRDARLGEVVDPNGPLPPNNEINSYLELAGTHRAPVLKMIDKNVELKLGFLNGAPIYLDARQKDDPAFRNVFIRPDEVDVAPGSVALYTAEQARKFELCKAFCETRQDIESRYNVSFQVDFRQGREPKACRIEVTGQLDDSLREKLRRQFDTARAQKDTDIFLVLECAGGDPAAARNIADDILALTKADEPIRTVAYVPRSAPDLALFVALAANEVVMYKSSAAEEDATLGDFSVYLANAAKKKDNTVNADFIKRNLLEVTKDRYPPVLIDAFFDRDLAIVEAKNVQTGEKKLMTRQEQEQGQNWQVESTVKERGTLLKLTASKAKELRVATETVDNRDLAEVYRLYSFDPAKVRNSQTHWLDSFAAFLKRTEISILLVLIGIGGLILELKVPGMTVPGIVAAICFVLFFWSQSGTGELIWLAVLLFLLGLVLIGIEIFILPGFGVTGVSGILLVVAGLGLAAFDRIPQSGEDWVNFGGRVMQYGLTMVAATTLTMLFARYLPKIPYANRLMLVPPTDKPDAADPVFLPGAEQAASLLGATGVATSMLRPAGMARFGDVFVDVVTEGDFVSLGTPIQVIEVEGTRIVVKAV